jgi:hypothetical protein
MLHTKYKLPRLPRTNLRSSFIWKNLRSSPIFKTILVVFHISSSWVKIKCQAGNQLPGLPRSKLSSSSIKKILSSSSIFQRRLHTDKSASLVAWKCLNNFCDVVVVWWAIPLLCQSQLELRLSWTVTTTQVEVELDCDNKHDFQALVQCQICEKVPVNLFEKDCS